jgi:hypothetical protein
VWINPSANVLDQKGNKQDDPLNRRVRLTVKIPPYNIVPHTANNPVRFGETLSPVVSNQIQQSINYVTQVYGAAGMSVPPDHGPIIMAQPRGSAVQRIDSLYGTVTIFDVVKNVIVEDHKMAFDGGTKQLVYLWNGRNKSDKAVATGSYVAVMRIKSKDGTVDQTKTVRIGVKR